VHGRRKEFSGLCALVVIMFEHSASMIPGSVRGSLLFWTLDEEDVEESLVQIRQALPLLML
jgi:hypothetical protein